MKRTIAAILALSPAMLFAQTSTPAQPSSTPVLLSSLANPAVPASAEAGPAASSHISTGVLPPKLLSNPQGEDATDFSPAALFLKRTVVIDLTVDATGKPTDLKVEKSSSDSSLDANAIKAVSEFRFKPAMLNGQPTSIPMRLNYVVQQPIRN